MTWVHLENLAKSTILYKRLTTTPIKNNKGCKTVKTSEFDSSNIFHVTHYQADHLTIYPNSLVRFAYTEIRVAIVYKNHFIENEQKSYGKTQTYLVYSFSNSLPNVSGRPGHSLGHMRHQSSSSSTRCMNKSGTHKA
uniref:Uncharacterized protein n=1 Tax=Romanomermis culicivorax TaxID=13658 RepID=A0A915INK9_ROMCU